VNWKRCGSQRSWPDFKVLSRHSPGRTKENHEELRTAGRRGRDLNPEHPVYEGVLTTQSQRSVFPFKYSPVSGHRPMSLIILEGRNILR
jgi:hypothetical protein